MKYTFKIDETTMVTPIQKKNGAHQLRRFKVGVIGASGAEIKMLARVLTITRYRTRCYELIPIASDNYAGKKDVDIAIICDRNPDVVTHWEALPYANIPKAQRPSIKLLGAQSNHSDPYSLGTPLNPSRLIKLLDQYTIKEFNFLPEFEIGHEQSEIEDMAFSGLKLLRANKTQLNSKNGHHKSASNGLNALVVDDSLAVRRQMQIEFELLNDDLDLAENAESALAAINKKKYDIIFLDVVMPGQDGYSVCKQIKRNQLNRSTPVIMLTSRSSKIDKIKGTLSGCDAYLVKPINHNEFTQTYNQFASKQKQGDSNGRQQSISG